MDWQHIYNSVLFTQWCWGIKQSTTTIWFDFCFKDRLKKRREERRKAKEEDLVNQKEENRQEHEEQIKQEEEQMRTNEVK